MDENNNDYLLKIENLDMQFRMPALKMNTLKERVVNFFKGKRIKAKTSSIVFF